MSDTQADLFAVAAPDGFDDTPAGQVAHIKALLDRDDLFTDQHDVPMRVYYALCGLAVSRQMRPVTNALIPAALALRDFVAREHPELVEGAGDVARAIAAIDEQLPRTLADGDE